MECEICKTPAEWLEIVGKNFCCYRCINKKNKMMGTVLRTHADTFRHVVKKLKVPDYEALAGITKEDIESVAELKRYKIHI
jgi:hypothetical protein